MSQQAQGMQGVRRGSFGEQHWAFAEHLVPSLLFPWMFSTWGQVYVLWVWARITSYHHFGVVGAQVLQHFTNKIVVAGWWNDHPASWSGKASMPCPTKLSDMQRCWSVCLHWSFSLCMTWPEGCGSLLESVPVAYTLKASSVEWFCQTFLSPSCLKLSSLYSLFATLLWTCTAFGIVVIKVNDEPGKKQAKKWRRETFKVSPVRRNRISSGCWLQTAQLAQLAWVPRACRIQLLLNCTCAEWKASDLMHI